MSEAKSGIEGRELYCATPNQTEQNSNDGNNQQYVDDTTGYEASKEANGPDDNQNNGDDVQ